MKFWRLDRKTKKSRKDNKLIFLSCTQICQRQNEKSNKNTSQLEDEKSFQINFFFYIFRSTDGSANGNWIRSHLTVWFISQFNSVDLIARQSNFSYLVQRKPSEANLFVSIATCYYPLYNLWLISPPRWPLQMIPLGLWPLSMILYLTWVISLAKVIMAA